LIDACVSMIVAGHSELTAMLLRLHFRREAVRQQRHAELGDAVRDAVRHHRQVERWTHVDDVAQRCSIIAGRTARLHRKAARALTPSPGRSASAVCRASGCHQERARVC